MHSLDKNLPFWSSVMKSYSSLCRSNISLESWSSFKKDVLLAGLKAKRLSRSQRTAEWRAALRGDLLPEEDLPEALRALTDLSPARPPTPPCDSSAATTPTL